MTFNVLYEPWLPVRWRNGDPSSEIGLYDALSKAHEIVEIATDNPLETSSLNRLLAALVASVFPALSNKRFWYQTWTKGSLDTDLCDLYFKEYAERFDLLSPTRPFYSDLKTDTENPSPLTRLQHAATSGSNAALFSHDLDAKPQSLTLAEAARAIICAQASALCGGVAKPFNLSDAPLVSGAVFWVRGVADQEASLFRALLLNLAPDQEVWGTDQEDDQATWEPPEPPKPKKRDALGLRDLLTFQSRRLRLELNDQGQAISVHYNQGSKLERLPFDDPHMAYREGKEELCPLRLSASRALWRDSALFMMTRSGKGHAPRAFEWLVQPATLRQLGLDRQVAFAVDVFGLVSKKGKAKVELWQQERVVLFPEIMEEVSRWSTLDETLKFAEDHWKNRLREATCAFASRVRLNKPWHVRLGKVERRERDDFVKMLAAENFYWPGVGARFSILLPHIARQPVDALYDLQQRWQQEVKKVARRSLQQAVEPFAQEARSMQALAEADTVLSIGTLYPKKNKHVK